MALSSKNAKPLAQLKYDAFKEAAKALKTTSVYEEVFVDGVSAKAFAEVLLKKSDELKRKYPDLIED